MNRLLIFTLSVFLLVINAPGSIVGSFWGRIQKASAKGRLLCGVKPSVNTLVRLYDEDDGFDPDDLMGETRTDYDGEFRVSGQEKELTPIDPVLKIYHDCDDSRTPGLRMFKIKLPNKYIDSNETMDIGTWNLEMIYEDEKRVPLQAFFHIGPCYTTMRCHILTLIVLNFRF
uniref:Uncharacterized protein n=1 Tax=Romanomermis culicivorax TaxID=13658 RepID=A0A915JQQ7_ROMCU